MTQKKLAAEANIDRIALANIETGKRCPTVTTVYRISQALGVKVSEVFKIISQSGLLVKIYSSY